MLQPDFLHHGERAHVGLVFSEIEGSASAGLERFNFFRIDQSVALNLRAARETTDAYDADKLDTAVTATRYFGLTNKLLRAGLAYGYSDSLQAGVETIAQLASIPLDGVWDTRDDLLDPSRGYQLVGQFRPYADVVNDELRFQSFFGDARTYVRIRHSKPRIIWAIRGASGVLTGADRYDIPPDIRFYAGGGGSVRGYAYQSLGDHVGGQPVGGNSLIELSNELRFKLGKTWGVVAFVDGGNVFATSTPDWEEGLSWGGGVGIRYHTPIGPVRADVAVPVDRREDIDETYQFYISLGQAF